jgi:multidrug efflux pump subunit AcrA (membrane-fusion protein)
MPFWRTLGKAAWVVRARTLPKTLAIAGLILVAALLMTFVQKDFYLKAKGSLQPSVKQDVFVPEPGVVIAVNCKDQDPVEEGQVLVELRNTDLDVRLEDVRGQRQATQEQIYSAKDSLSRQGLSLSDDERIRLAGQVKELTTRLASLNLQEKLLETKREQLKIKAPISGRVMLSWDVEESLLNRTVEPGQVLMTVADPEGDWELELFMKETRSGHVDNARRDAADLLEVKYVLATAPGRELIGKVAEVEEITQMHEEEGHTVRIRAEIDKSELIDPRPGTTVRGKVKCGTRALGYTWFHEAWEWVQANIQLTAELPGVPNHADHFNHRGGRVVAGPNIGGQRPLDGK